MFSLVLLHMISINTCVCSCFIASCNKNIPVLSSFHSMVFWGWYSHVTNSPEKYRMVPVCTIPWEWLWNYIRMLCNCLENSERALNIFTNLLTSDLLYVTSIKRKIRIEKGSSALLKFLEILDIATNCYDLLSQAFIPPKNIEPGFLKHYVFGIIHCPTILAGWLLPCVAQKWSSLCTFINIYQARPCFICMFYLLTLCFLLSIMCSTLCTIWHDSYILKNTNVLV